MRALTRCVVQLANYIDWGLDNDNVLQYSKSTLYGTVQSGLTTWLRVPLNSLQVLQLNGVCEGPQRVLLVSLLASSETSSDKCIPDVSLSLGCSRADCDFLLGSLLCISTRHPNNKRLKCSAAGAVSGLCTALVQCSCHLYCAGVMLLSLFNNSIPLKLTCVQSVVVVQGDLVQFQQRGALESLRCTHDSQSSRHHPPFGRPLSVCCN